ncbi:MAG: response regulator [Nitrospina sp.]|jgi:two-component system chemotaxis response regulator CheY|nr:response regulator [Nitrospina sp.]MBT3876223.1 response regulator [Nitrospina sp.]MBT4048753.1 response regulator [Nitrospina sp.]MBT4556553.1 response regulator [Nitrospina sp.]MBT5347416.1 response regulator [Nitrospina sp.]
MNFSKKILLVEDSPFQRTICVSQLKQVGFENIEVADDGNVGYSMLEEGDFDLVLCDWEMPELNGIQLLKKVKKNAALQHIPFLMLTSIDDHERLQEAIEAGALDYIVKPGTPDLFKEKLGKHI